MTERKTPAELRVAIVFLRAVRGWDQAELAAAAGVSKSSIYRYESGEASPSPRTFRRIVEAVGVPPATMERLFAVIRSARATTGDWRALARRAAVTEDVDSLAARFADEMFFLMRDAAALILKEIAEDYGAMDEAEEDLLPEN